MSATPPPIDASAPSFSNLDVLRSVLDAAPDAMIIVDPAGLIRYWNLEAETLFGHTAAQICGEPIERVIPSRFAHVHRAHREAYKQAPRRRPMGIGMELHALRRDGTEVPVEVSLSPIAIGDAPFVIASVRDMGPKRRAEEDRQRLRRQDMLIALWELALHSGSIDECLHSAVETLQAALAADRIILHELAPDRRPPQLRRVCDTASAPTPAWSDLATAPYVAELIGNEMAAAATGAPAVAMQLSSNASETALALTLRAQAHLLGALVIVAPRGRIFSSEDIYFVQSVAHLLAGVLARNRSDQLLLAAAKMETLGQISGGIAHDFNNLLSIISGNLEILEMHVQERQSLQKFIQAALRATRRGGELTQRLLLFTRRRPAQPILHGLAETLPGLVEVISRVVGESIDVRVDAPGDLPDASIDPSVLDACVINLAANARDAMPQGGTLALHATLVALAPDGSSPGSHAYVALAVTDTGHGMEDAVIQRAFEPFYTTKEAGKGTGLGLSLVQTLMRQIGGHVSLSSKPGAGTTVTLYFPAGETATCAAVRERVAAGSGETILVVEDEDAVRETATRLIEELGYHALPAATLAEAVAMLDRRGDIALVFSDVRLSRSETGLQLVHHVQATRPDLPVILTSGHAQPALEQSGPHTGEIELLHKPYTGAQLAAALRRAIARSGG